MDFEQFIQEKHMDQYVGCKGNCVEDYESWIEGLDFYDLAEYAEQYANRRLKDERI